MTVIDRVHTYAQLPAAARAFRRDTITLGWEERARAHAMRRSDHGVEFGTSLPRGTMLREGDHFVVDAARVVVAVIEQPEAVFVVSPRSAAEWARFAYQIGNRHQPLMITGDSLVCPDAPGVEQLLLQHQMPYARDVRAFTPIAGGMPHAH